MACGRPEGELPAGPRERAAGRREGGRAPARPRGRRGGGGSASLGSGILPGSAALGFPAAPDAGALGQRRCSTGSGARWEQDSPTWLRLPRAPPRPAPPSARRARGLVEGGVPPEGCGVRRGSSETRSWAGPGWGFVGWSGRGVGRAPEVCALAAVSLPGEFRSERPRGAAGGPETIPLSPPGGSLDPPRFKKGKLRPGEGERVPQATSPENPGPLVLPAFLSKVSLKTSHLESLAGF